MSQIRLRVVKRSLEFRESWRAETGARKTPGADPGVVRVVRSNPLK